MKTWKYQKTQISKNNENKDNREEKKMKTYEGKQEYCLWQQWKSGIL